MFLRKFSTKTVCSFCALLLFSRIIIIFVQYLCSGKGRKSSLLFMLLKFCAKILSILIQIKFLYIEMEVFNPFFFRLGHD